MTSSMRKIWLMGMLMERKGSVLFHKVKLDKEVIPLKRVGRLELGSGLSGKRLSGLKRKETSNGFSQN
jgi:hypothetical protein